MKTWTPWVFVVRHVKNGRTQISTVAREFNTSAGGMEFARQLRLNPRVTFVLECPGCVTGNDFICARRDTASTVLERL